LKFGLSRDWKRDFRRRGGEAMRFGWSRKGSLGEEDTRLRGNRKGRRGV
jgi:hypothetical protein